MLGLQFPVWLTQFRNRIRDVPSRWHDDNEANIDLTIDPVELSVDLAYIPQLRIGGIIDIQINNITLPTIMGGAPSMPTDPTLYPRREQFKIIDIDGTTVYLLRNWNPPAENFLPMLCWGLGDGTSIDPGTGFDVIAFNCFSDQDVINAYNEAVNMLYPDIYTIFGFPLEYDATMSTLSVSELFDFADMSDHLPADPDEIAAYVLGIFAAIYSLFQIESHQYELVDIIISQSASHEFFHINTWEELPEQVLWNATGRPTVRIPPGIPISSYDVYTGNLMMPLMQAKYPWNVTWLPEALSIGYFAELMIGWTPGVATTLTPVIQVYNMLIPTVPKQYVKLVNLQTELTLLQGLMTDRDKYDRYVTTAWSDMVKPYELSNNASMIERELQNELRRKTMMRPPVKRDVR
jgi:hypothetical protein